MSRSMVLLGVTGGTCDARAGRPHEFSMHWIKNEYIVETVDDLLALQRNPQAAREPVPVIRCRHCGRTRRQAR